MKEATTSSRLYQYFEKDYLRNESSFGIVSLFEEIYQFSSYDDYEHQKSVLISSFGTEEFECFGSCYCENANDENNRRISHAHSQVLIEGVSYLLAAISSVVAFNVAKDYFSEKCSEKYSNICESKSIKSEVNNCEKVVSKFSIEEREEVEGEEEVEKRVYFCYGNCLDSLKYGPKQKTSPIHRPTAKEKGIDCKKLKQEGEMIIYSNDLITTPSSQMHISNQMSVTARFRFSEFHLVPFCKENSKIEYEYQVSGYNTLKSGERKKYFYTPQKKRIGYMCCGVREKGGKSHIQNVRCRQIDPEPTGRNSAWQNKKWWEEKEEWDKI